MNITYRTAKRSDIPRIKEIFNAQYVRKKEDNYFVWQYFESAWPTVVICAEVNGRVEGMFGLQRRELEGGIPVGQAIDLLITPSIRGKGVFAEMGRRAIAQFPELRILCVLPNLNGRNACIKSLGWQEVAKVDSLILNISQQIPGMAAATEFLEDVLRPLRFNWTSDLRAWRYTCHPDYTYEIVNSSDGHFAVTKVFTDPLTHQQFGDIVDFHAPLDDPSVLVDLFTSSVNSLAAKGVESITTWALPSTMLYNVLKALGFEPTAQERYFCVKILDPTLEHQYDISSWSLVQADAEIY